MCGICGYQGIFKAGLVQNMMNLIAHRGPDDKGFFEDPANKVALGHTRLSIIDLRPEGKLSVIELQNFSKSQVKKSYIRLNSRVYKGHRFLWSILIQIIMVKVYSNLIP